MDASNDSTIDGTITSRAKDFVELHEQVESSLALLSSLESFLGTFQNDLKSVSGHIADLQARSKDFDTRLRGRRKIALPLADLLTEITIPPQLVTTILDTPISDSWIASIKQLEGLLDSISTHATASKTTADAVSVKAARDLEGVAEGLRIAAATKIRAHFISLLHPIRTSVTTNLHVIQTSIFINKYLPLFQFLQRRAKGTADEFRAAYVRSAKLYYETGMRRYTRSLGYVKTRVTETPSLIGNVGSGPEPESSFKVDDERLSHGKIDGPSVMLAYQADDKAYLAPVEAIYRSALLVLLDNTSAEYAFIRQFFRVEPFRRSTPVQTATSAFHKRLASLEKASASTNGGASVGPPRSELEDPRSPGADSETPVTPRFDNIADLRGTAAPKEDPEVRKMLEGVWKQIFDPVLPYFQTLIGTLIAPPGPPLIPLLTMIRLTDSVLAEASTRGCAPLESFLIGLKMQLWPLFQKGMSDNVDSLKKLADNGGGSTAGAFSGFGAMFGAASTGMSGGKTTVDEGVVAKVSMRYVTLFTSVIALSGEEEEGMLFVNLQRMRTELNRLIGIQAQRLKDPGQSAAFTAQMCDKLLTMLSSGERLNIHPKAQAEMAFWREREEEARRRMASTRR
ncbi:Vps52-domain-containing protein [Clavulina sp. PMI_390]|nr:Vps52-domain-containing protein [Clavulina sp. PMI_390]